MGRKYNGMIWMCKSSKKNLGYIFFSDLKVNEVGSKKWATPFGFHTPPVEYFKKHLTQGECEFQVASSFGTYNLNIYSLCDKPNLKSHKR